MKEGYCCLVSSVMNYMPQAYSFIHTRSFHYQYFLSKYLLNFVIKSEFCRFLIVCFVDFVMFTPVPFISLMYLKVKPVLYETTPDCVSYLIFRSHPFCTCNLMNTPCKIVFNGLNYTIYMRFSIELSLHNMNAKLD